MPKDVEAREWWDRGRRRLCFEIDYQGRRIPCSVDATCLFLAFGAKTLGEEDARDCFSANRRRIRDVAIAVAQKRATTATGLDLSARDI